MKAFCTAAGIVTLLLICSVIVYDRHSNRAMIGSSSSSTHVPNETYHMYDAGGMHLVYPSTLTLLEHSNGGGTVLSIYPANQSPTRDNTLFISFPVSESFDIIKQNYLPPLFENYRQGIATPSDWREGSTSWVIPYYASSSTAAVGRVYLLSTAGNQAVAWFITGKYDSVFIRILQSVQVK